MPFGEIRPMLADSVYHMFPSGPVTIDDPTGPPGTFVNSVSVPEGVIRPIVLVPGSVNHRLPSGPTVIPPAALAVAKNVNGPPGGVRQISAILRMAHHRLPSGPTTARSGIGPRIPKAVPGIATPLASRCRMLPRPSDSQSVASGPAVRKFGCPGVDPSTSMFTACALGAKSIRMTSAPRMGFATRTTQPYQNVAISTVGLRRPVLFPGRTEVCIYLSNALTIDAMRFPGPTPTACPVSGDAIASHPSPSSAPEWRPGATGRRSMLRTPATG